MNDAHRAGANCLQNKLCMVEDLNDDEIMELCVLSNELNACETEFVWCLERKIKKHNACVEATHMLETRNLKVRHT